LSHVTFVGMDRKMPQKLQPQFDHLGPLMIPAGEGMANAVPCLLSAYGNHQPTWLGCKDTHPGLRKVYAGASKQYAVAWPCMQ
jgi:hypothetical protein